MQRNFLECFTNPPKQNPIDDPGNNDSIELSNEFLSRYPSAAKYLQDPEKFISDLPINHEVGKIELQGTRQTALGKLDQFIQYGLSKYDDNRNDPDENATSGLSPWLHFGKISEYEIVDAVLDHQPEGWSLYSITFNKGSPPDFLTAIRMSIVFWMK